MNKLASIALYIAGAAVAVLPAAWVGIRFEPSLATVVTAVAVAIAGVVVGGSLMTLGHILGVAVRRQADAVGDFAAQLGATFMAEGRDTPGAVDLVARFTALTGEAATLEWSRFRAGKKDFTRVVLVRLDNGAERVVARRSDTDVKGVQSTFPFSPTPLLIFGEGAERADDVPLGVADLNDPWFVAPADQAAAAALVTPAVAVALNTFAQPGCAVAVDKATILTWSSADEGADANSLTSLADALFLALRMAAKGRGSAPSTNMLTADPRIGGLRTDSAARAQSTLRGLCGIMGIGMLAAMAFVGWRNDPPAAPGSHASWQVLLVQAGALVAVGLVVTRFGPNLVKRQRAVASHALELADGRGWRYRQRDLALEAGWGRRPFADVERLTASPVATGPNTRGGTGGVAYLEGDLGAWPAVRVFSSRVVWAQVPAGLPTVTIAREGFSDRLAKLVGGKDLNVESYAFNKAWRVIAADERRAHALLTPAVIDLLNSIAEDHVCFLLDGERVLLWDDGTAKEVDLDARARWVDDFAAAIPRFLSE